MQEKDQSHGDVDHSLILDRIYEIALEPGLLDDFIDLWADHDLAAQFAEMGDGKSGAFDRYFKTHLERAETFLTLGEPSPPDFKEALKPYDAFAAFVVNKTLNIEVANVGAEAIFDIGAGDSLHGIDMPADMRAALTKIIQDVLRHDEQVERLLKTETETEQGTLLFRVVRLAGTSGAGPAALVATTHIHWRDSIGAMLNHAFQLTVAEQDVVRKLTEGHDAKSIAATRGTSVETVREQIKSIRRKMNVRSQADVVRMAVILSEFPQTQNAADTDAVAHPVVPSKDWLETEVWKPFKSLRLPDGRTMMYHDMGPQNGNPVLCSHMGSAMVRWTRPMIKLAFENNLRVICPIRAGYGQSDPLEPGADVMATTSDDTVKVLDHLGISRLPYAVLGTDFPLAADLVARHPGVVSELIGLGARPCFPDGSTVEGAGLMQRFFVWAATHNPRLVQFASKAVMMKARRIGPEAMLRQLCKDSPADLASLEEAGTKQVLIANLELMVGATTHAGQAFAMEYTAFHADWSHLMPALRDLPVVVYIAAEDPTIDAHSLEKLRNAYPWMTFARVGDAGLALIYQKPQMLIPELAQAAKRGAGGGGVQDAKVSLAARAF